MAPTADLAPPALPQDAETASRFVASLAAAELRPRPYPHWLLSDVLPEDMAAGIAALPFSPAEIGDTRGKRDTNNQTRVYFSPENRERFAVCDRLARTLQGGAAVDAIERSCGIDLSGTSLRIEYCQDTDGFWLEPHTDIGVKRYTMLVYLSSGPGTEDWGTDVLDGPDKFLYSAPFAFNGGLIFVPSDRSWHGFRKRPIRGVRKSIIVNYVTSEWRARHELAFPDTPVA
ncbi:2OG-Fe(II) oxygenase [Arenibaculum pallidiluteum]|uniref:2OG-Fe(II) oxygenase n=1 Tax=Arenibaculum pallidiluteum TaxID=2812559 RepID=UPI001F1CCAC0|nr:2OG-Fe(II) oxygenase [Arenibaculum pallidiluteum]